MDSLYSEIKSLYRMDQLQGGAEARNLGPLPETAVLLLSLLAAAWLGMGVYCLILALKKKKLSKSH